MRCAHLGELDGDGRVAGQDEGTGNADVQAAEGLTVQDDILGQNGAGVAANNSKGCVYDKNDRQGATIGQSGCYYNAPASLQPTVTSFELFGMSCHCSLCRCQK